MSSGSAYQQCDGGLAMSLRVTPNAKADRIEGYYVTADGNMSLRVRVTAQAEKGKANKAVIALLAKALGVARSTLEVTGGSKDRNKTVAIRGDFKELARRVDGLLGD